jgi:integrase/recombinase XerC
MHASAAEWLDRFYRFATTERRLSPHTVSGYASDLTALADFCDAWRVRSWQRLEVTHVRAFAARSHANGLSGSSVQRRLSAVRTFLKFLIREGVIGANPAVVVQAPRARRLLPTVLDVDQMARLLEIKDSDPLAVRDLAIMELLYSSALRLTELIRLDRGDLDPRDRTVRVMGKGNVARVVPVGRFAVRAIDRWLRTRSKIAASDEAALFTGRYGKRLTGRGVELRVKYWARRQGIGIHVYPHVFRHSCATHLLESSGSIREVQEFLGHVSISTTQIYTHLDFQHLAEVYDRTHPRAHRKGVTWTPATESRLKRSHGGAESASRPLTVGNEASRAYPGPQQ